MNSSSGGVEDDGGGASRVAGGAKLCSTLKEWFQLHE